ncbi:helix-turn-helix transcriptional regulator [Paraburkholderia sp. BL10I2N1]|uniref:helix-turn-helix transcriptional regulator n=1 Tax=Paraburkholderia sp. BL10I2N1 TaxID=1938796 RepID=UPI001AAC5CCE|nr:helix-turn-helix transcriptional regulator [Paraburkholderia sp. BL10I2N1]
MKATRTGSSSALTPRQEEILELVTRGISNKAIAAQLGISIDTVRRHGARIKQKRAASTTSSIACQHLWARLDNALALSLPDHGLTPAETRVVAFLCRGLSSKEIARALKISSRTVDKHREHVLRKLGMHSTRQLTAWVAGQCAKSGVPVAPDKS